MGQRDQTGQDIATLRAQAGLTQLQLAFAAGVSLAYVGLLERGYRPRKGSPAYEQVLDALAREAAA